MPKKLSVAASESAGRPVFFRSFDRSGKWFTDARLGALATATVLASLIIISPIGASVAIGGGLVYKGLNLLLDD